MNLQQVRENGLFALGHVLRFPVMVLLWVCVVAALFMAGSCMVDFVARRSERHGKSPEVVITNTRDPGKPEMTSMDKFLGPSFARAT